MFVSTLRGDLPSATLKSTFFTDATGGYPGGVWYFLPPLPDRVASDEGPGQRTVTYGVVAARRPPMDNNRPTLHVPQPLLHWVRRLRATQALYGLSGWCC